jgi:hypothetical protein
MAPARLGHGAAVGELCSAAGVGSAGGNTLAVDLSSNGDD